MAAHSLFFIRLNLQAEASPRPPPVEGEEEKVLSSGITIHYSPFTIHVPSLLQKKKSYSSLIIHHSSLIHGSCFFRTLRPAFCQRDFQGSRNPSSGKTGLRWLRYLA